MLKDLDEVGERVATLERKDDGHSEENEWLQIEILRLQEQQIDLQSHTEDLENRSWRNNVPTVAEGTDLEGYETALFGFILGYTASPQVKLDRCHRVGPLRQSAGPRNILICVHDF
ncbi:hypothetical protein NDU88_010094 [Pleurodeles waltl]|uniref:Uncharacterized protein n=1 Tax=Pleurodeles waltl TaxID=8319 RepID=A0AAV7PUA0_PLEWA|nr:hypothetical protein NDU88_010094 [Pleurodeles waltl]